MHQNFAGKLHKLTRLLTVLSEHRWASDRYGDIKIGHLQALVKLNTSDFTNNQLAAEAGITKQSMGRLTNELLTCGYIVNSEKRSHDGREKLLTLSARGKVFISYLNTTRYDLENKFADVLGTAKFLELNRALDTLLNFVEERHRML